MSQQALYEELYMAHERYLWGLCYRLTGNAADADDIVQQTFVQALKHPPARTDQPWLPWLVRVAMNLGRDLLRRRRRRPYEGPWLPSPIDTGDDASPPSYEPVDEHGDPRARYEMLESISFAFLLALETLTPNQRAVLLLRDVFDYSVEETAAALDLTAANVKTTLHRARTAMRTYQQARQLPTRALQQKTRRALERFLACLANHDVAGAESLLAADARQLSDGGGEYLAARLPVVGAKKIVTFFSRLLAPSTFHASYQWRLLNGLPALVAEISPSPSARTAPRSALLCELDANGRIIRLHTIVASAKLQALFPPK